MTVKSTDPIGSMTQAQVLAVVGVLADHAKSQTSLERAAGCAHAALDIATTWIAHR